MVIVALAVAEGQPPEAGMVFTTMYDPGVLADKLTSPLGDMNTSPAEELNVPALEPTENVGLAIPVWQYGPA
jgi:hypothetical protein